MEVFRIIYILKIFLSVTVLISARHLKHVQDEHEYVSLLMPNVQPQGKETYICTTFAMPENDFKYIVEFKPNGTMRTAHHILIHGCEEPGKPEGSVWQCAHANGPVCKSGFQIIYAWALNAPDLKLPEGVAFKVGKGTGINFLVLQLHYAANVEKFIKGGTDDSGVIVSMLPSYTDKVTKVAGVYLLGTYGRINSKEEEHFESSCKVNEHLKIHPFAFRVHTHALGKVVSGYVIKNGTWYLLGKRNPHDTQMFYPVEDNKIVIEYGDVLASRCTMYNFRDRTTFIGKYGKDEMCNFYVMYYVDGDKPLDEKMCFRMGPSFYYWNEDPDIDFVPKDIDLNASILDA